MTLSGTSNDPSFYELLRNQPYLEQINFTESKRIKPKKYYQKRHTICGDGPN